MADQNKSNALNEISIEGLKKYLEIVPSYIAIPRQVIPSFFQEAT